MAVSSGFDSAQWRDFEHAGWETVAQGYHDWLGPVTTQAVEPILDAVGAGSGVRLLDVATGPGYVAVAAAARGASVVGVDFSAAVVAAAVQRHPTLQFREADAEALPFPDGSFDAVTIAFGVGHFPHPDRALAEAARVLSPGGRLAFTDWVRTGGVRLIPQAVQAHGDTSLQLPAPPADLFSDPARCERTLRAAGFLAPSVVTLPLLQRIDDPEAYFETVLKGAGPRQGSPLRAQPTEALAAVRSALLSALRSHEVDGVIQVPMPARLISAQKA